MSAVQDGIIAADKERNSMAMRDLHLIDMHCHLDRMTNCLDVAEEASDYGVGFFCTTVTPRDTLRAKETFAHCANVRVGVGLHPWWVDGETRASGEDSGRAIEYAATMAAQSDYIGEIGLDLSPAHEHSAAEQLAAFELIVRACAEHPRSGRVISLHAACSANKVLDMLERYDLHRQAACIFHWFSGTSNDLARLRNLGCYISVNERMLATRRGREYARQMPAECLLLETDAPEQLNTPHTATQIEASLARTLHELALIRGVNERRLCNSIAHTSSQILGL